MSSPRNFLRYNTRYGIILTSNCAGVKLKGFDLPEFDSNYFVLSSKEIPGKNKIRFGNKEIPLLASDYVSYVGQPILALFAPDYEKAELALEKIKPIYENVEQQPKEIEPFIYSQGECNEENLKEVKSVFTYKRKKKTLSYRATFSSWLDNKESLNVSGPIFWQALTKKSLSLTTGEKENKIRLHPEEYYLRDEEWLLLSLQVFCLLGVATELTNCPAEMQINPVTYKPEVTVETKSYLNADKKIVKEESAVSFDIGAFNLYQDEAVRAIMASLIPHYSTEQYSVEIEAKDSQNPPVLLPSFALEAIITASRSFHNTRLALALNSDPSTIVENYEEDTLQANPWVEKHDNQNNKQRLLVLTKEADYKRKWGSSSILSGSFGLTGELKGIGLSTAFGLNGFSRTMAEECGFSLAFGHTSKKTYALYASLPPEYIRDSKLRESLFSIFFNPDEKVLFAILPPVENTPDSGPDILSHYSSHLLSDVLRCAKETKEETSLLDTPVGSFLEKKLSYPTESEYAYSGFGSAIVDLSISKVSLVPMLRGIWLDLTINCRESKGIRQKIKELALYALSEEGIKISKDFKFTLHLTYGEKESTDYSSISSIVSSLVLSALSSAFSLALGKGEELSLPLSSETLSLMIKEEK